MSKNKELYITPDNKFAYDPLNIRRRLLILSDNKLNDLIVTYNEGLSEIDRLKAEEELLRISRTAFGLPPLTPQGGVPDEAVLEYLGHFLEWLLLPSQPIVEQQRIDLPCLDCLPKD